MHFDSLKISLFANRKIIKIPVYISRVFIRFQSLDTNG